jgi:hypothetical protein
MDLDFWQQAAQDVSGITQGLLDYSSKKETAASAVALGEYQAAQLQQNAGQTMAASQRQAYDIQRQADYLTSRAIAAAAGSGGGANDPTVLNLIARNAGEMAYRKSLALYGGQERARQMGMEAQSKLYEGATVGARYRSAANISALKTGVTLLGDAQSLNSRFGGGGPKLPDVSPSQYTDLDSFPQW